MRIRIWAGIVLQEWVATQDLENGGKLQGAYYGVLKFKSSNNSHHHSYPNFEFSFRSRRRDRSHTANRRDRKTTRDGGSSRRFGRSQREMERLQRTNNNVTTEVWPCAKLTGIPKDASYKKVRTSHITYYYCSITFNIPFNNNK